MISGNLDRHRDDQAPACAGQTEIDDLPIVEYGQNPQARRLDTAGISAGPSASCANQDVAQNLFEQLDRWMMELDAIEQSIEFKAQHCESPSSHNEGYDTYLEHALNRCPSVDSSFDSGLGDMDTGDVDDDDEENHDIHQDLDHSYHSATYSAELGDDGITDEDKFAMLESGWSRLRAIQNHMKAVKNSCLRARPSL